MNNQVVPENETNEFTNEYFDFSGRIGGTTYFLRALLANILQFVTGFICGLGWELSIVLFLIGCGMLFLALWYSFAPVYKRANAIDPENVKLWTAAAIAIGCISIFDDGSGFFKLFTILGVVIHLIFIFKNAEYQKN